MQPGGAQLAFVNCDRITEHLRESARRYCSAYMEHTGELPEAEMIAGAMLLALREGTTNAGAVAAMFIGLKQIAAEALTEVRH